MNIYELLNKPLRKQPAASSGFSLEIQSPRKNSVRLLALMVAVGLHVATAQAQTITTVAGNGGEGYSGDGGSAANAQIEDPEGIVYDDFGNLYVSGYYCNCVRKIAPNGAIITVAGTGIGGFGGDGGPAKDAKLWHPRGLAVDAAGNLYIADTFNNRIRKVGLDGLITTVAGNGSQGYSPSGGQATNSKLFLPEGVVVDVSGNIYIADTGNNLVWVVEESTGAIYKVAGVFGYGGYNGDEGMSFEIALYAPSDVELDADATLYIADRNNHRIRKVVLDDYTISTVVGSAKGYGGDGGPATAAKLNSPRGVTIDSVGNLYIADNSNHRIRKVIPNGIISTVAGTGGYGYNGDAIAANKAKLYYPRNVALDAVGNLYVADTQNNRVRKVTEARADVVWRNTVTGANDIWRSADSTSTQAMNTVADLHWNVVGNGDYNGDGTADVLWRYDGTGGANSIWLSGKASTLQSIIPVSDLNWKVVGSGDFNRDGKSDILWRHSVSGGNTIWLSGDYRTQQPISAVSDLNWQVVGIGDFNKDGYSDIFWRHSGNGNNSIWGKGSSSAENSIPVDNLSNTASNTAWKVAGIGDFDGDGSSDVLWRDSVSGYNTIWQAANAANQYPVQPTDPAWIVAAVGDVNDDGEDDIVWRHEDGSDMIWKSADEFEFYQTPMSSRGADWKIVGIDNF